MFLLLKWIFIWTQNQVPQKNMNYQIHTDEGYWCLTPELKLLKHKVWNLYLCFCCFQLKFLKLRPLKKLNLITGILFHKEAAVAFSFLLSSFPYKDELPREGSTRSRHHFPGKATKIFVKCKWIKITTWQLPQQTGSEEVYQSCILRNWER